MFSKWTRRGLLLHSVLLPAGVAAAEVRRDQRDWAGEGALREQHRWERHLRLLGVLVFPFWVHVGNDLSVSSEMSYSAGVNVDIRRGNEAKVPKDGAHVTWQVTKNISLNLAFIWGGFLIPRLPPHPLQAGNCNLYSRRAVPQVLQWAASAIPFTFQS